MVRVTVVCTMFSVITVIWSSIVGQLAATGMESANALDCKKKLYTFQVSKTDSNGRVCSDEINVMSCWGRCDSNEVSFVKYLNKYVLKQRYSNTFFPFKFRTILNTFFIQIFEYVFCVFVITEKKTVIDLE